MKARGKGITIEGLFTRLKADKKMSLTVLVFAAGVVILLLAAPMGRAEKASDGGSSGFATLDDYTAQYAADMETRLTDILGSIRGAGEVKVYVTLETGAGYIYAQNESTSQASEYSSGVSESSERDSAVLVIDGQSGEQPIVLYRTEPVVKGVVVVCEGAGDVTVRSAVIEAVTTACNIGANRVSVSELS